MAEPSPDTAATDEWELAKAVLYVMRQIAHGNGIGYCVDRYLPEPLRSNILVQAGQESWS